MTHTKPMSDDEGTFTAAAFRLAVACRNRKCRNQSVTVLRWDSDCGGYTDWHCKCSDCGHAWWIEGADA